MVILQYVENDFRLEAGSGIAVFIPDNKRGCGKGGWMVFSDIGHLSGCIEKSGFAGRRLGDLLFTIYGFSI